MKDKSIVVYATQSSFGSDEPGAGLQTYIEPLVEKRIDSSLFKNVNALVRPVAFKDYDSNRRSYASAPDESTFTQSRVSRDDT